MAEYTNSTILKKFPFPGHIEDENYKDYFIQLFEESKKSDARKIADKDNDDYFQEMSKYTRSSSSENFASTPVPEIQPDSLPIKFTNEDYEGFFRDLWEKSQIAENDIMADEDNYFRELSLEALKYLKSTSSEHFPSTPVPEIRVDCVPIRNTRIDNENFFKDLWEKGKTTTRPFIAEKDDTDYFWKMWEKQIVPENDSNTSDEVIDGEEDASLSGDEFRAIVMGVCLAIILLYVFFQMYWLFMEYLDQRERKRGRKHCWKVMGVPLTFLRSKPQSPPPPSRSPLPLPPPPE